MSSKFTIAQIDPKTIQKNLQHEAIIYPKGLSMRQNFDHGLFQSQNIKPGQSTTISLKFNSKSPELDKGWFVDVDVSTTDALNHPTFFNDVYSFIQSVEFEPNGSKETIKYINPNFINLLRSDALKCYGDRINEKRAESDINYSNLTGVQVTNAQAVTFTLNLFDIFPFLKDQVMEGLINEGKLTIGFAYEPTDTRTAGLICQSNTASNAYTTANIRFDNITFRREYDIIVDPRSFFRPPLSNVIIPIPFFTEHVISSISWNTVGTDKQKISLQDIFKHGYIQKIISFVSNNVTTYNHADAQKKFSGHNYIKYKLFEQDGDRNELSFLSTVKNSTPKLRKYEIDRQNEVYGVDLPIEVYTNTTDLNKYILNMSDVYFNHLTNNDKTFDSVINYDPSRKYMNLELECAGAVSANCDLYIIAMSYDLYRFGEMGGRKNQLIKVNV